MGAHCCGTSFGGLGTVRPAASVSAYPSLSVSVGAARFVYPTPPLAAMLRAADLLMYQAKQAGSGSLAFEDFPAPGFDGA